MTEIVQQINHSPYLCRCNSLENEGEFKNHAIRGPINSWMLKVLSSYMNRLFGDSKTMLFKNHPDLVVEIGAGAGSNMEYLRKGTRLIAIEPSIHMHENLRKSAEKYDIKLEIKTLIGEAIDLPDNYCEFVVSTLVLCTVKDIDQCLRQVKRILKPSGKFAFIEHVKAKENTMMAWLQNKIHRPWLWFFEGCHTNRDIKTKIESAGFSELNIEEFN